MTREQIKLVLAAAVTAGDDLAKDGPYWVQFGWKLVKPLATSDALMNEILNLLKVP